MAFVDIGFMCEREYTNHTKKCEVSASHYTVFKESFSPLLCEKFVVNIVDK